MQRLWISVKRGFIRDPKHRQAIGECIWLFEYMLDIADWATGTIEDWKDEAVADDMQMPVRTIRDQRRKLDEKFYISCTQKQYGQSIKIYNWTNPRNYAGEIINPRPALDIKGDVSRPPSKKVQGDTQGDTQGSAPSVTPTSDSKSHTIKHEEKEVKVKTSALLCNVIFAIDPEEHGTLTISDPMRKQTPTFVIGWLAKTCHDTKRGMRSPIGYLTSKLKGTDEPDVYYINNFRSYIPESYLEKVDLARYACDKCDATFKKRIDYEDHFEEAHPIIDDEEIDETDSPVAADDSILQKVAGSNLNPMQAWDSVLGSLRVEVPRASYDAWLRDTAPLRWDDRVVYVGVEDGKIRDILEDRFTQVAQRLLVGVLNADVQVQFVVIGG